MLLKSAACESYIYLVDILLYILYTIYSDSDYFQRNKKVKVQTRPFNSSEK